MGHIVMNVIAVEINNFCLKTKATLTSWFLLIMVRHTLFYTIIVDVLCRPQKTILLIKLG